MPTNRGLLNIAVAGTMAIVGMAVMGLILLGLFGRQINGEIIVQILAGIVTGFITAAAAIASHFIAGTFEQARLVTNESTNVGTGSTNNATTSGTTA